MAALMLGALLALVLLWAPLCADAQLTYAQEVTAAQAAIAATPGYTLLTQYKAVIIGTLSECSDAMWATFVSVYMCCAMTRENPRLMLCKVLIAPGTAECSDVPKDPLSHCEVLSADALQDWHRGTLCA